MDHTHIRGLGNSIPSVRRVCLALLPEIDLAVAFLEASRDTLRARVASPDRSRFISCGRGALALRLRANGPHEAGQLACNADLVDLHAACVQRGKPLMD